jgi:hypothetical protein
MRACTGFRLRVTQAEQDSGWGWSKEMPDYYAIEQMAQKLGMQGSQVSELLAKAGFLPRAKNGRNYYLAREFHQLQAALRLAGKHNVTFEEALRMVFERASRMKQASSA